MGYIILLAAIGSMVAILVHERKRIKEIEAESAEIRQVRRSINTAHRRITGLATLGEGVVNWNKADYLYYRNRRLQADSLLNLLKRHCREYVRPEQIDTLRALLAEKETHLLHIMEMFERRTEADSVLVNQLPEVARRATHIRTIEQKKKGIAGFFGKKEEIQVMPSQKELHDFSDSLIAIHQRQASEMDIYADSLRMRNRELNRTLNKLINDLDEQAQTAFSQRELKMAEAEKMSFFLMAGVIGMAIILLIISHLIIMRDLNRRERDKAELEDTATQNRTLSDMRKKIIITLSHDIRGPLNAISGSAELAMDTRDRKRRNAYLGNILESSRHITRLANSLLDLSRLDDAKETLNEIPFHLESFLESIAEEYTRKANDKGLMFDKAFMGCGITALGDADRIRQIVVNILENAVKFTRTGYIKFLASYEEDTLSVKVKDTGIGMGENTTQRIFQPFERAAPDLDSEGFGLGLSITKGLVNLFGGRLSVSSQIGKGSEFKVEIPLRQTNEPARDKPETYTGNLRLPRRVLVVDDDPIQLRNTVEMMERNGISCRACTNAQEVVKALRTGEYDLLLTDIQMRGTGGFDLLHLLRLSNIGNSRTIPIAAMTARNDGDADRYIQAGLAGCIHKPFYTRDLLEFLSSLIGQDRTMDNHSPDFEALYVTTGDERWTLETLIEESNRNSSDLLDSLSQEKPDRKRIWETLHRMYPMWEQLGIAHELESYSYEEYVEDTDESAFRNDVERIVRRIDRLISETKSRLS